MAFSLKPIFQNKKKIFLFSTACSVFTLLMFPFGDLSDALTAEIAKATNNQVYIQFDDLALGLIPQPALTMTNVKAEMSQAPELAIEELSVAPSLLALLKQKPLGRVYGEGFFGGVLDLSVSGSSKLKEKEAMSVDVDYNKFQIKDLMRALQKTRPLPVLISGTGQLKAQLDIDPAMKSQPDGNVNIVINKMQMPNFNLNINPFGDLALPGLNMDKLQVKGTLKNGRFTFADTVLGTAKDDFSGKISGNMDMRFSPNMSGFNVGAYDLAIDITFREAFVNQMALFMPVIDGFIGKFRQNNMGGQRYAFRIQAGSVQETPQFTAL